MKTLFDEASILFGLTLLLVVGCGNSSIQDQGPPQDGVDDNNEGTDENDDKAGEDESEDEDDEDNDDSDADEDDSDADEDDENEDKESVSRTDDDESDENNDESDENNDESEEDVEESEEDVSESEENADESSEDGEDSDDDDTEEDETDDEEDDSDTDDDTEDGTDDEDTEDSEENTDASDSDTENDESTDEDTETGSESSALNGHFPTTVTEAEAQQIYDSWKGEWVTQCPNDSLRVKWDNVDQTVSEGIGYGMLLAASWEDQETFDGLWQYYQNHTNINGLMDWKGDCNGPTDAGAATDADLDVAMSLIMADCAWPSEGYGDSAATIIGAIRDVLMMDDGSRTFLCAGDNWGDDCCGNASYQTPAYYRAFAELVGDTDFWNGAAEDSYYYLEQNSNASTGLASDWMDPENIKCDAKGFGDWHGWDASRVPWRVTVDYIWWGTEKAETYANVVADFIESSGGVANSCQGYSLDGSQCTQGAVSTFAGAFATTGIAKSQQISDAFFDDLKSVNSDGYFNAILNALYFTTAVKKFIPGCY